MINNTLEHLPVLQYEFPESAFDTPQHKISVPKIQNVLNCILEKYQPASADRDSAI
jgi:hypothetical protein